MGVGLLCVFRRFAFAHFGISFPLFYFYVCAFFYISFALIYFDSFARTSSNTMNVKKNNDYC